MDKRTSDVWNHYSVINNEKAKCSYCTNSFSYKGGSTANLSKHLKRKHIIQYEARKIRRMNVEQDIDEPNEISPSQQQVNSSNQDQPSTSTSVPKNRPVQTSVYSFVNKPLPLSKQKLIDEQLGNYGFERISTSKFS